MCNIISLSYCVCLSGQFHIKTDWQSEDILEVNLYRKIMKLKIKETNGLVFIVIIWNSENNFTWTKISLSLSPKMQYALWFHWWFVLKINFVKTGSQFIQDFSYIYTCIFFLPVWWKINCTIINLCKAEFYNIYEYSFHYFKIIL